MKKVLALLTLLATTSCYTSETPTTATRGAQCSKTATYYDGSTEISGKARDEGNGIVSQPRGASNDATGAQAAITVLADCKSGKAISVGYFGTGGDASKVDKFLANARSRGQISNLDGLLASAKISGFPQSQSFQANLSRDADLNCACQLAQSGRLPRARN